MNEYTLITSIGTGMYKKEGGYRIATYRFNNGKTYESKLFFDAILKTEFKPIKKIIFIGTYTSSWDVLIDDKKDSNLWIVSNLVRNFDSEKSHISIMLR